MATRALAGAAAHALAALGAASLPHFLAQLFGQSIPAVVSTFLREAGAAVMLGAVFVFALAWLLRARPRRRPSRYSVVAFDVFGRETRIDGIRTSFAGHDVAWSFMRQYKEAYPLHCFALVADAGGPRRTIFRYI